MSNKTLMWVLVFVGSTAGSFIPSLWGAGFLSMQSFIGGAVGTALGVWLVFKINGY
jgi:hypothetical protein